jgi:hypothetical protein
VIVSCVESDSNGAVRRKTTGPLAVVSPLTTSNNNFCHLVIPRVAVASASALENPFVTAVATVLYVASVSDV